MSKEVMQQAQLLCEWIAETPHQRGSINGLAAQVLHSISAALAAPQPAESPCACWPGRMCSRSEKCAADVLAAPQRQPLTDEQKQRIHNETGAGHSLICLVESYINEITKGPAA